VGLRSACELDGDLALEDSFSVQLGDGTLGLSRGGESDEGVADGARGAGIGGDGGRFAVRGHMLAHGYITGRGCTYTR
jgi:hypothetical protein